MNIAFHAFNDRHVNFYFTTLGERYQHGYKEPVFLVSFIKLIKNF